MRTETDDQEAHVHRRIQVYVQVNKDMEAEKLADPTTCPTEDAARLFFKNLEGGT